MLAEIAIANAAFAVIKEAVQNSGEIMSAGKAIVDYFGAKSAIQKKVEEAPHDGKSDLEEFFALEELKKREQELKELMIYQGRPGLWDDWLRFQVQARQKREQAARDKLKADLKREEDIKHLFNNVLLSLGIGVLILVLIGILYWVLALKGAV